MKKPEFNITTTEKRSDWIYEAVNACNSRGIDTLDCGSFIINGKSYQFEIDSELKINGLIRNF